MELFLEHTLWFESINNNNHRISSAFIQSSYIHLVVMPRQNKRKTSEPYTAASKVSRSISLTQLLPMSDDINTDLLLGNDPSSQSSTNDVMGASSKDTTCRRCNKNVSTDTIHVTSLKCCLCDNYYHGSCLNLANPTLISFLHVVADIGGWACVECRKRGGKAPNKADKKFDNLNTEISLIKAQLDSLSDVLKKVVTIPASTHVQNNGEAPSATLTYSQVLQSSSKPSALDTNVRNAVLSAVHTEFKSINNRSQNIVVTGLKPSNIGCDADQFSALCASELHVYPSIKSTHRLGDTIRGRIQPLLVTLQSSDDVQDVLSKAKLLRNSTSEYVRHSIFINRHMTKAEALAAYNAREQKREKLKKANSNEIIPPPTTESMDTYAIPQRFDGSSIVPVLPMATIPSLDSTQLMPMNTIYSSANIYQPGHLQSVPASVVASHNFYQSINQSINHLLQHRHCQICTIIMNIKYTHLVYILIKEQKLKQKS